MSYCTVYDVICAKNTCGIIYHTEVLRKRSILTVKLLKQCEIFKSLLVGKSSLQLNSKLWRISGRFHTLIWKPGDTVQNLESPRLSRRVDITVVSFYHQYIFITRHMKNWCHFVFYNNKSSKKTNC